MKRETKDLIKATCFLVAFIAALAFAGRADYYDAVITEMQNNGRYDSLTETHPDASDGELVKLYLEERDD